MPCHTSGRRTAAPGWRRCGRLAIGVHTDCSLRRSMPTLHIVIPVFNEPSTLEPCLRRVLAAPLPPGWRRQIELVDDHSDADHFPAVEQLLQQLKSENQPVAFHHHTFNRGKGAALQTGFDAILASDAPDDDLVIIQDADL